MKKQKLIAIAGPSATGKTQLAINIAKEVNGEIISVDSRQIYKQLNIGSAKPTMEERFGIPHHMIDVTDITEEYTVANFADEAKKIIQEITDRNKTAILAGGTGLYFRVLLQDFDLPRVAPDAELRAELNKKSTQELYDMLKEKDSLLAEKIHFNNKVKIVRALEVCIKLNMPMSQAQKKKSDTPNIVWAGLFSDDRAFLYERAYKRADIMFEKGLLEEARQLFLKYGQNKILMNTIGYQELYPFLQGEISVNEAKNAVKINTSRYIKRQISWFKSNKNMNFYDIKLLNSNNIQDEILQKYYNL